jgi:Lon protease-like protein
MADALLGDRIIGMVLLRPGYEADYEGRPPVYPVGCAGLVTHCEPLADGRYNIVLRGLETFRITDEDRSKAYRVAHIDSLPEDIPSAHREEVRKYRTRLEALLAAAIERSGADPKFPPAVPDEDLVNALAQYLQLEPLERQALLEREGILERCRGLIELLEMKTMTPRGTTWKGRSVN